MMLKPPFSFALKNQASPKSMSMAAAFFLHGALASWIMMPSNVSLLPQQQVIRVSLVAPSSLVEAKPQPQQTNHSIAMPQPEGLKKAANKKKQEKNSLADAKASKTEKQSAEREQHYNPTSGPESPNATDKQAALVEPVFDAAYLNNPAPSYPATARRNGIQGKTMLEVEVTSQGEARSIHVVRSSGSDLLDEAAQNAVRRWRFVPARRSGQIVEAKVIVPIEFKLN